jgi:hypothetical protein
MTSQHEGAQAFVLPYYTLRSVNSPEDTEAGRRRYCGVTSADNLFGLTTEENVRSYLGRDEEGGRRKSTKVNMAIRATLNSGRDLFPLLNAGLVIVCREAKVDDSSKPPNVTLKAPSIVNGAQTQGVLHDYFLEHSDDTEFPSVNFELIVTNDVELIEDISIARNFQNEVASLSIYGRRGRFDALEAAMRASDPSIHLRKAETDFGSEYIDTEKLIQVLTVFAPSQIKLPSAEKRNIKTAETIYRVYAYRHRSRCLSDFAVVMDGAENWREAYEFFLSVAVDVWSLYWRLKGEQAFSRLVCVKGDNVNGNKKVLPDGVPDGLVFPMLSALSRFIVSEGNHWQLRIPEFFPWPTFYQQTITLETNTAKHNPQTMGKDADCYIALHGLIDMFLASRA